MNMSGGRQAVSVNERQIHVSDLMRQCNDAVSKMSVTNSHRLLLINCAYGLRQLVDRLADLEGQVAKIQQQQIAICTCPVVTGGHLVHTPSCPVYNTTAGAFTDEAGYGHAV